jgi:hypothetical protein
MKYSCLIIALALGGCASMGATKQASTVDTFSLQSRRTWSVNDTAQTIHET